MNFLKDISNSAVFKIIFVVGFTLRFIRAFIISDYGQDEAINFKAILDNNFIEHFIRPSNFIDPLHPPFSFIIYKINMMIFDSELWLRVPSFIFSIFSILVVILISKIIFENNVFLKRSFPFLFAVSSFFIIFGVTYNTYAVSILLGLCFVLYFLKLELFEEGKSIYPQYGYTLFFILTALSFFADYCTIYIAAPLFLYQLSMKRLRSKTTFLLFVAGLVNVPWVLHDVLYQFNGILELKSRSSFASFTFLNYLQHITLLLDFKPIIFKKEVYSYVVPPLLALSAVGFIRYSKTNPKLVRLLSFCCLFPVMSTALFTHFISPIFSAKAMWFACLIILLGILFFIDQIKNIKIRSKAIVIFILIQVVSLRFSAYGNTDNIIYYHTHEIKHVLNYLSTQSTDQPKIVVVPKVDWVFVPDMYLHWHQARQTVKFIELIEPRTEVIDISESKYIYYFDVESLTTDSTEEILINKFGCKMEPILDVVKKAVFKRCVKANN